MSDFSEQVSGIGALAEPVRRALYLFVCAQTAAVGRDEAADAVGVPHHKAKFHLDKLEAEGLLETEFARLGGKTGPGAGRPSKLYRRTSREIAVSLPGREYELAGLLMAEAIAESSASGVPVLEALNRAAAAHGRTLGESAVATAGIPRSRRRAMEIACATLAEHGYEPHEDNGQVTLANCPFHALASAHTDMVCGMNLALIDAMVDTIDPESIESHLDPATDRCCVVLTKRRKTPRQSV